MATTYTEKFASQLGTVPDFVAHVRALEKAGTLGQLSTFSVTSDGKRYMLIKKGGVIDFRHFFAAMTQRLDGALSKPMGIGPTTEGTTLLLGVLNEVSQCVSEGVKRKLNSCFSREDLISNRHGARFGEIIVIQQAQASRLPIADHLSNFLTTLSPLPASDVQKLKMQSNGQMLIEATGAVLKSISHALIPRAY